MNNNLVTILLRSAAGAFIQVTVFVGVVLLFFGYIDYRQQGAFVAAIERSKKYQPLIGSLLGILPGCGGSILVMPLYVKGTVSFGTVVATLIATAGDSAFVTLTQAPRDFAIVTLISFAVGTATGYVVDYYRIGEWVKRRSAKRGIVDLEKKHEKAETILNDIYCENPTTCRSRDLTHIGHKEGDEVDMILHHETPLDPGRLGYRITHNAYIVFWVVIAAGFILGLLELLQVDVNKLAVIPDIGLLVGVVGTVIMVLYMIFSEKFVQAQTHEDVEHKLFSLEETLIHNAQETAFVGAWVFAAYLAYEIGVYFAGGEQLVMAAMTSTGLAAVMLGVLVGIIPGCGPQVIFVSLYLKGMFPLAALVANAVSQDGDAIFPLIALDRRAALWSTVISTIVALMVGLAVYYLEVRYL